MGKCALIVDDSRTSRAVLQRILETHELTVDTAVSAESALDYLTENRPDVIFMDHLMPGMDGFEAVAAIKRNPVTATIPIMMYTSQKGDVYVGQARALGAVGVLPKEVEPVEVSKILESLRIVGDPAPPTEAADSAGEDLSSGDYALLEHPDQDMRLMLEDLFDQQRAILKRDLLRTSDAIAAKVADQIGATEDPEAEFEVYKKRRRMLALTAAAIATLAGIVIVLSTLLLQAYSRLQNTVDHNTGLAESLSLQEAQSAGAQEALLRQLDDARQAIDTARASTLDTLEWGINRSGSYPFDEPALGDARVADFEELSARLQAIDFAGQVVIETHVGRYCLALGPNGYRLASPEIMADRCDTLGFDADAGIEMSRQLSVAMANLVNASGMRTNGAIRFLVVPRGLTQPIVPYPVNATTVTAGEWNAVAAANNRIAVVLLPDATTP